MEKPMEFEGSSDEIPTFFDEPSLNDFHEMMSAQADPDNYDAAPMPKDWDMGFP
jgi:hypothetical protein